jgi:endonuclease/exonuclease/phosphatase (EEP) superfamily protein YafD
LDWQGGYKRTIAQLSFLKKSLESLEPNENEIICGDFNTLGFLNHKQRLIETSSLLGNTFKSSFDQPYITVFPYQQLDYIFVKGLEVEKSIVCELPGSDHFPIMASFKFSI